MILESERENLSALRASTVHSLQHMLKTHASQKNNTIDELDLPEMQDHGSIGRVRGADKGLDGQVSGMIILIDVPTR